MDQPASPCGSRCIDVAPDQIRRQSIVTRYHRKWDRRDRLLRACLKLLAEIVGVMDSSVEVGGLSWRTKWMVSRIKRELDYD